MFLSFVWTCFYCLYSKNNLAWLLRLTLLGSLWMPYVFNDDSLVQLLRTWIFLRPVWTLRIVKFTLVQLSFDQPHRASPYTYVDSVIVSRFLDFFLCIGSSSLELCSANSNCFSLFKYLHLSPQLSKSAMLCLHSPQWPTWVFQKCKVGSTLEKSINIINHINILKETHANLNRQMQKNHSMKFNNYQ